MEGLAKDDPRRSEYPLTTSDGDGSYVLRRKAWESTGAFVARWQWVEKMRGEGLGTDTQEEAEEVDRMSAMWHNMVSSPLAAAPSPSTRTLGAAMGAPLALANAAQVPAAGQVYLGCRYDEELEERLGNPVSLVKMPEKEGKITQQQAAKAQEASVRRRTKFSRSAFAQSADPDAVAGRSLGLARPPGRRRPRAPPPAPVPLPWAWSPPRPSKRRGQRTELPPSSVKENELLEDGGCEGGNGGRDVVRPCGDAAMGRAAPPRKRRFLCATFGTGRTSEVVQPGI